MGDRTYYAGEYSSVSVPGNDLPPWDTVRQQPDAPMGGPAYPAAQAPIYVRALPSQKLFAGRRQIITEVAALASREFETASGGATRGSTIAWTTPISGVSHVISLGDFLFTDATLDSLPLDTSIGAGNGSCLAVFSSFAGHSTTLPPGYLMVMDSFSEKDPLTGAPQKALRPRNLVRLVDGGRKGEEVTDRDEEVRIMRDAWRERNRSVRFVGVAASSYIVGGISGLQGIAAQVSGSVTVVNTSGKPLLFRDLVTLALPGEHVPLPLYPKPFDVLEDPRATLRIYSRREGLVAAVERSVAALLVPRPPERGSYLLEASADGAPPATIITSRNGHYLEPTASEALADLPKENHAALVMMAFAEAAIMWGAAVSAGGDITTHVRDTATTQDRTVNPLRLGLGAAMGLQPADIQLERLAAEWGVVSPDQYKVITKAMIENDRAVLDSLPPERKAYARLRTAAQTMLRTVANLDAHAGIPAPFGQVMESGEPGALVSIKLL